MSKKHCENLALALEVVKPGKKGARLSQWQEDVEAVAAVCASENSRFDYTKFLEVGD